MYVNKGARDPFMNILYISNESKEYAKILKQTETNGFLVQPHDPFMNVGHMRNSS